MNLGFSSKMGAEFAGVIRPSDSTHILVPSASAADGGARPRHWHRRDLPLGSLTPQLMSVAGEPAATSN